MARPYEHLNIWIQNDRELKEEFILQNKNKWLKIYPNEFFVSVTRHNNLGPYAEVAVLSTKEVMTISKRLYEIIRKKFREFKYWKNHKSKGHLQARISKNTKLKLENIKRKLEHGNASTTLEHMIKNFDEDKFKLKLQVEDLQELLKVAKSNEALLTKRSENTLKMQQAYDNQIHEYLFNQCVAITLKLKMLDQYISSKEDIDSIYESFDKIEKEAAQAEIITKLKSRLEDEMLNIKASLKPASDEVVPLNVNTSQDFHENTKILPRFSSYAKEHPTSHKSSVSESLPEENPDTEIPSIKTNTKHSHLREDLFNPFKKNT